MPITGNAAGVIETLKQCVDFEFRIAEIEGYKAKWPDQISLVRIAHDLRDLSVAMSGYGGVQSLIIAPFEDGQAARTKRS